jgi:hypothetical protein
MQQREAPIHNTHQALHVKLHPSIGLIIDQLGDMLSGMIGPLSFIAACGYSLSDSLTDLYCIALAIRQHIPTIEFLKGDGADATVLTIRHLLPLSDDDKQIIIDFAQQHSLAIYTQSGGPESVSLLHPKREPAMFYRLPKYNARISFGPGDFLVSWPSNRSSHWQHLLTH